MHEVYLNYCFHFLVKLNFEDFKLTNEKRQLDYIDMDIISEKNKDNILNFYSSNQKNLTEFFKEDEED